MITSGKSDEKLINSNKIKYVFTFFLLVWYYFHKVYIFKTLSTKLETAHTCNTTYFNSTIIVSEHKIIVICIENIWFNHQNTTVRSFFQLSSFNNQFIQLKCSEMLLYCKTVYTAITANVTRMFRQKLYIYIYIYIYIKQLYKKKM